MIDRTQDAVERLLKASIEPPPGGLARLVDAVNSGQAHGAAVHGLRRWASIASAAAALSLLLYLHERQNDTAGRLTQTLAASFAAGERRETVRVANGAALELHSSDEHVRMLWIASLPRPPVPPDTP